MDIIERRKRTLAVAFAGLAVLGSQTKRARRVWVKTYRKFGHLPLIKELREKYPSDFKNYLRMDDPTFHVLLGKVKNKIKKQNTVMRESITTEARLVATLRFLATGQSYEELKFSTGISAPSLSKIIPETCRAIYESLKLDYLQMPSTKQEWKLVAEEFQNKWQFINCGGAMDGKHIRIVPLPHSGATYYNYKHFYSIVLLAVVGPNHEFLYVDVGKNGRMSDGGILEETTFHAKLNSGELNLPENDETVNNYNFTFLGDEAFGLDVHFLKPYAHREIDYEKRIFNYRLSRARNVSENSFGIMSSRFRVLHTAISLKSHDSICYVVLAICALHNFLIKHSDSYMPTSITDRDDVNVDSEQLGEWHGNAVQLTDLQRRQHIPMTLQAKQNRENYKHYFNTDGRVEWQDRMIAKGRA